MYYDNDCGKDKIDEHISRLEAELQARHPELVYCSAPKLLDRP
jgi:hypothetical protein